MSPYSLLFCIKKKKRKKKPNILKKRVGKKLEFSRAGQNCNEFLIDAHVRNVSPKKQPREWE